MSTNGKPDTLILEGLSRYLDGEYPFDLRGLLTIGHEECMTNREIHRIKTMAGVRFGELPDALAAEDMDVRTAIAAIVLTRAGKRFEEDVLWDGTLGSISFRISDLVDEEDADLTPLPDEPGKSSERSSDGSSSSSGTSSDSSSETPESARSRTGPLPSGTSA